ncbi:tetratricopeptide repeat protein [Paraliomyxa miuraensis]|uniref:tetratricopeptide repeat protein n=1 Tax=Paraliomyxa miuraensis TaxID=376150 RepID=UPI00224EDB70|nr:tetratricopeptide repeat protein [Paraliomyxa miuraensis]MCX4245274.1 tetratricopeptide repeat protein [Paraliomyxa miuraensis]
MSFEQQGQLELAAEAAQESIDAGGGRSASLQAAKVAILRERWDDAEGWLRSLTEADPKDADAHYNLGLIAQRRGRYNEARSGYLSALRAREDHPEARYNLVVLTWNRNVHEEARHHAARFMEKWPDDPRAQELATLVGAHAKEPGK